MEGPGEQRSAGHAVARRCRGRTGWTTTTLVTEHVTNRSGGRDRPVFVFNSADAQGISQVHAELYVDPDPTRAPRRPGLPPASRCATRTACRSPRSTPPRRPAGWSSTAPGSEDPEARPLTYQWYVDPPARPAGLRRRRRGRPAASGEGIVIDAPAHPGAPPHRPARQGPRGLPDTEETTVTIP